MNPPNYKQIEASRWLQPATPLILREKKKVLRINNQQSINKNNNEKRQFQKLINTTSFQQGPQSSRMSNPLYFSSANKTNLLNVHARTSQTTQHETPHQQHSSKLMSGQEIRKTLDQNLNHIYGILNQRKLTFAVKNNKVYEYDNLRGPRLQQKLVQQYIRLIYNDYDINDPLPEFQFPQSRNHQRSKTNFDESSNYLHDPAYDEEKGNNLPKQPIYNSKQKKGDFSKTTAKRGMMKMSKKAINLKQSFLLQLFSPVSQTTQPHYQVPINNSKTENSNIHANTLYLEEQPYLSGPKLYRQVEQNFRYCFVCQQPVLQANLQAHQRLKCPQFAHLYKMSINSLRTSLIKKILRIKKQTEQLHELIFCNEQQKYIKTKLNKLKQQTWKYLYSINSQVDGQKLIQDGQSLVVNKQLNNSYESVIQTFQKNYFCIFESIKKLQWFIKMLEHLEQKYYFLIAQQRHQTRQKVQSLFINNSNTLHNRRFSLGR